MVIGSNKTTLFFLFCIILKEMLAERKIIMRVMRITLMDTVVAEDFIRTAVDFQCKSYPEQWFSVRILFGGATFQWPGTPLECIYDRHIRNGRKPAKASIVAARDIGKMMTKFLSQHPQNFNIEGKRANEYLLTP